MLKLLWAVASCVRLHLPRCCRLRRCLLLCRLPILRPAICHVRSRCRCIRAGHRSLRGKQH
jgi:hypothetical protein